MVKMRFYLFRELLGWLGRLCELVKFVLCFLSLVGFLIYFQCYFIFSF